MDEAILERLEQLGKAIERLESRFDGLENRFDRLERKVDTGFEAVRIDIAGLSGRIDIVKETVDALDAKMNKVQEFMAYHDAKVLEHDKEIFALKRKVF